MKFENKLVAIINKDIEVGVAMNAIAHMCLGLGSSIGVQKLRFGNYQDMNGNIYPNISEMPFIILRGKSGEIRKAINAAKEKGMQYGIFTNTMTGGTYQEQIANTQATKEEDLIYSGVTLFGHWEEVSLITKKFSLYK